MPKYKLMKGSDLKVLLKRKKISQKELCEALGYNQATLSRYFTDNLSISAQFLVDMMIYSKISVKDVIEKGIELDSIAPHLLAAEAQAPYGSDRANTIRELRGTMKLIEDRLNELESIKD